MISLRDIPSFEEMLRTWVAKTRVIKKWLRRTKKRG